MKNNTEFRYRIIYEALSLFSSKLSKCDSFECIADCLRKNMKYILDFHLVRLSFYHNDVIISYTISCKDCTFEKGTGSGLWKQEKAFFHTKVPVLIAAEDAFITDLSEHNILLREQPKDIWGWDFQLQDNSGMLVTLATNNETKFSRSDVPVLKLVVENLSSKLLSLILVQELDVKKRELEKALASLKLTNDAISRVVNMQEELIDKRTAEIKEKNRKLLQISKHNAHTVREPLSRIMGLLMVIEQADSNESVNEFLPMLCKSTNDLNKAINTTVNFVDDQIIKMKIYEDQNNAG